MQNIPKKLEQILPKVEKPGQYVGSEVNSIIKSNATYHFALCFADTYDIGMSNHGLRILYEIINSRQEWSCERAFTPLPDMEQELRNASYPLGTLESGRELSQHDIVSFSLQYELGIGSVLTMLDLGNIPLKRTDRSDSDPLIIAGGHATFNPEPFSDFFDLFFIGEGEEGIQEILDVYQASCGMPRGKMIEEIAQKVPGIYAPALYQTTDTDGFLTVTKPDTPTPPYPIKRRIVQDFKDLPMPVKPIIPLVETVHERVVLEIMRGCPNGCRFCQAGNICRPVREKNVKTLRQEAKDCYHNTGYDEIGLMSLSTSDYTCFDRLVAELDNDYAPLGVSLSLPSLRVNHALSAIPEKFKTVRRSGLTLAPEAGTDRLRRAINKDVTDEDLLTSCAEAFKQGWRTVKLYFMVGLPTETDEDVIGIARLATQVARLRKGGGKGYACTVSVSNFIPKPFTPFQWEGMASPAELTRKHRLIAEHLNTRKIDFKWHNVETSFLEGVFSRGDRRLGEVALRAWQKGARLEGWSEYFAPEIWTEALEELGIDAENYACSKRELEHALPWSHIDSGLSDAFFKNELKKAYAGTPTSRCNFNSCAGCGQEGCGYTAHKDSPPPQIEP